MADSTGLRWQCCPVPIIIAKLECTDLFSAPKVLGSSCWGQRPKETSPDAESWNSLSTWGSGSEPKWIYPLAIWGPGIRTSTAGCKNAAKAILVAPCRTAVSCLLPHPRSLNMWAWALDTSRVPAERQTCWGVQKSIWISTSPYFKISFFEI